jgi:hypothetical protein
MDAWFAGFARSLRSRARSVSAVVAALVVAVLAVACAHDVNARFPSAPGSEPGDDVGSIELAFAAPVSSVSVALNGVMVVRDVRTERITIADVPTGYADLAIAAGAGEKQVRVWVDGGRTTAVPLGAAVDAPLSTVRSVALSLLSLAVYTLLR